MELAKREQKQEMLLNAGVWGVVLLFLALAGLQVYNLSSGCSFSELPYEYIWAAWSAMIPNTCTGPRFASVTSDRRVSMSCKTNATISLALYPEKIVRYDTPRSAVGDFTVAQCQLGAVTETNILVHLNKSMESLTRAASLRSSLSPTVPAIVPPSVLVLVISGLSDAHFKRSLPYTAGVLRDEVRLEQANLEVFNFNRYTTTFASPLKNMLSILKNPSFDRDAWLWQHYRSAGYVTFFAEEDCRYMQSVRKRFTDSEMIDHRFTELFCQLELRRRVNDPVEDTSAGPVCLGGGYQHEVTFDFISQFMSSYASVPRFGVALFNEANENSMVRIKSLDKDLRRFLLGVPNNTVVMLTSEMGAFDTSYALRSRAGKMEITRPFLYVISPKSWLDTNLGTREALRANAWRLISGGDIHATLRHLPYKRPKGDSALSGSLFTQLSDSRSCTQLGVEAAMCACENRLALYLFLLLLPFSIIFWWLYTWSCRNRERRAQQSKNLLS